jgi:hypothetical protein
MQHGMLIADLGADRGVVEGTEHDRSWSARVEAPDQVYQSVFDYPTMIEAQAWVEQKIETLLSTPHSTPHEPISAAQSPESRLEVAV